MNITELLHEGFAYDLWANKRWLNVIPTMPDPSRPLEVVDHIAWAQEIWYGRIAELPPAPEHLLPRLEANNRLWGQLVAETDPDKIIAYQNTTGQAWERKFGAIARHVIDHGTYHRGQLRGLAEMQGFDDFPEAGMMYFFIEKKLHE